MEQISLFLSIAINVIFVIYMTSVNWKIKKQEIVFDKVKENKIRELKEFYKCYVELESGLRRLYQATSSDDIDAQGKISIELSPKWIELKIKVLFLNIFLSTEERKLFQNLRNKLDEIDVLIWSFSIDNSFGASDMNSRKEIKKKFIEMTSKDIPQVLNQIAANLRSDFGIK